MSTVWDVTGITVDEASPLTLNTDIDAVTITIDSDIESVTLTVPEEVESTTVEVPGMQGPPGVQNMYVQTVNPATQDPENPWGMDEKGFIWIEANV